MSATQAPLRFERVRNFGRVFSETRSFLKENFTTFFLSLLFLAGPVVIITCALEMYYEIELAGPNDFPSLDRIGSYLAMTTFYREGRWLINGLVIAIVVSHFVKVYREKGPGKFDVGDVTRSLFRNLGSSLTGFIIIFLGVAIITAVIGFLVYGLAELSIGAAVLVLLSCGIAYFLIRFPFWYLVYSVFFANTSGDRGIFGSIGFAGKFFSGNWWSTWVIFFCMWLLLYLVGVAISLPAEVLTGIAKLSSITSGNDDVDWKLIQTIAGTLGEFARTMVNSVFCIAIALHFHSLKEKVDGEGTKKLVESIGTKQEDEQVDLTY
ncbi:MAG TPA: hypothetical protein VFU15_17000 [Bacteroidia bacterium]|nr:hypothetical protein [Bacteroidia bacterium]